MFGIRRHLILTDAEECVAERGPETKVGVGQYRDILLLLQRFDHGTNVDRRPVENAEAHLLQEQATTAGNRLRSGADSHEVRPCRGHVADRRGRRRAGQGARNREQAEAPGKGEAAAIAQRGSTTGSSALLRPAPRTRMQFSTTTTAVVVVTSTSIIVSYPVPAIAFRNAAARY